MPTCGDSVIIQVNHTITIGNITLTGCTPKISIVLKGVLQFASPGNKLTLNCNSRVLVFPGGKVVAASGASGNSNAIIQCGSTWWNAGAGTYTGPGCMPATLPGCASIVLPIELLSFSAERCSQEDICVTWITLTEINNDHFVIERAFNNADFQMVHKLEASTEHSWGRRVYKWVDRNALPGLNYYRLRQVDRDGMNHVYPVTVVEVKQQSLDLIVAPNPVSGNFLVKTSVLNAGNAHVSILNSSGLAVYTVSVDYSYEKRGFEVNLDQSLPKGIYILQVRAGSIVDRVKISVL